MFEVAKELLERIEAALLPMPRVAVHAAGPRFGCNPCSGTCTQSCRGDCKGSCQGGCTRSCKGNSR